MHELCRLVNGQAGRLMHSRNVKKFFIFYFHLPLYFMRFLS